MHIIPWSHGNFSVTKKKGKVQVCGPHPQLCRPYILPHRPQGMFTWECFSTPHGTYSSCCSRHRSFSCTFAILLQLLVVLWYDKVLQLHQSMVTHQNASPLPGIELATSRIGGETYNHQTNGTHNRASKTKSQAYHLLLACMSLLLIVYSIICLQYMRSPLDVEQVLEITRSFEIMILIYNKLYTGATLNGVNVFTIIYSTN